VADGVSVETMFAAIRRQSTSALNGLILLISLFSVVH
jgi:hypothetical protein